jgi:subtilase family serine protease
MKGLIRAAAVTTGALSVMCVAQPAFADQDYCAQLSCYGPAQIQQAYGLPALYARGITGKGVTDVSMSAACSAPVEIYLTDGPGSSDWEPACGTSEAAPLFAGVIALADQLAGQSLGQVNPALYQLAAAHASGIVPVTSGSSTVSFYQDGAEHTITGYSARSGYSLAAGVGTINAATFVPELVAQNARDTAPAHTAHPPVPFMACIAPR